MSTNSRARDTYERPTAEVLAIVLKNYEEYAGIVESFLSRTGLPQARMREAIEGKARYNSLHAFKRWVAQGLVDENSVPMLYNRHDALLPSGDYLNLANNLDSNAAFLTLCHSLGRHPAMNMRNMSKLSSVVDMPFLKHWIVKGLLGPFTLTDVDCNDAEFFNIYKAKLAARVACETQSTVNDEDLLVCLSYMHTHPAVEGQGVAATEKLCAEDSSRLKILIREYLIQYSGTRLFLWVDQACKGSRAESAFDWLSEGLMPYAVLPVLKVSGRSGLTDVVNRLWLKVELTLGMNGGGVWWSDADGAISKVHNASAHVVNPDSAVSAVCRTVLAGYTQDLQSFWKDDFRRLQIWCVRILSVDRGPDRLAIYRSSAAINFDNHVELEPQTVRKIAMEVATQDQFNPVSAEAFVVVGREHRAIWTDAVPFIESGRVTRDDRVHYGQSAAGMKSLFRYLKFRTRIGEQFAAIPLSATPTGEMILGRIVEARVELRKVNLPVYYDEVTHTCLTLELARLGGAPEEWLRGFCKNRVREIDEMLLKTIIRLGIIPDFNVNSAEYVAWDRVY